MNKFKQISQFLYCSYLSLIFIFLCFSYKNVYAETSFTPIDKINPYVQLGVGASLYNADVNHVTSLAGGVLPTQAILNSDVQMLSFIGSAGIGLNFNLENVFADVEYLFITGDNSGRIGRRSDLSAVDQPILSFKTQVIHNLNLKLGRFLNDKTKLNVLIGASLHNLQINSANTNIDSSSNTFVVNNKFRRNLFGINLGLGLQHMLSPHMSIKLDYIYSYVTNTRINSGAVDNSLILEPDVYNYSDKISMHNSTILLSLAYYILPLPKPLPLPKAIDLNASNNYLSWLAKDKN